MERAAVAPLRCASCQRPPLFEYPGGLWLCIDHSEQYELMHQRRNAMLTSTMESLYDQLSDVWGMPRPPRPPRTVEQRVLVNQVHIHGNNNGIVNAGVVGSIENNLTIAAARDPDLASAIKVLTEAVLSSSLSSGEKRQAAELVQAVSEQASKPTERRSPQAVLGAIGAALGGLVGKVPAAIDAWNLIATHFGWAKF